MSTTSIAMLAGVVGVLGLIVGVLGVLGARALTRRRARSITAARAAGRTPRASGDEQIALAHTRDGEVPAGVADVLKTLRSIGLVLDSADAVVMSSPAAASYGLVRRGDLVHPQLVDIVRGVRRDGSVRAVDLVLPIGPLGRQSLDVAVRAGRLGAHHILLLVDDRSRARRVEEVRRDFVANVSHELKTPVGGLALLAEAVQDAADDPEAVTRFAGRMQVEADRLTRLVQDIVHLSRLQATEQVTEPQLLDLCDAARDAVDRSGTSAEAKGMELALAAPEPTYVFGDLELLTTAVRNLVGNAIAYSPANTRVAVAVTTDGDFAQVTVSDQGVGISAADQERIFERFYRVDAARSRATGGTGLGLAIVKHVCENHGGTVSVWSEPRHGSTFTIRIPLAVTVPSTPQTGADLATEPTTESITRASTAPSPKHEVS